MAIKKIDKVYCSLNLGYVYNVNYSFAPQQGVRITLYFINETGTYKTNILSATKKAQIKIGNAVFNMFPVRARTSSSGSEKTLAVDFIDETVKLSNYYIALTGKGCGQNVYQLGKTVDKRTAAEKEKEDPDLFRIKEFTTFEDVEYSFQEFIDTLKKVFPVSLKVSIDTEVTRPFSGTFAEVLNAWCSYFNLSYFFENGSIVIFDPVSLNITFPDVPVNAISSSYEESIEDMYDKTVWSVFQDNGGEVFIKADSNDNVFIANLTLYPWESIFNIKSLNQQYNGVIDLLQIAAAQYGREFWFLYNYNKGTAETECGFFPITSIGENLNISNYINSAKNAISSNITAGFLDQKKFEDNYNKYFNYGRNIAGRFYISNSVLGFGNFNLYNWYDVNSFNPTTIDSLKKQPSVNAQFFSNPPGKSFGAVEQTKDIGGDYLGLLLEGQRVYLIDDEARDFDATFQTSDQVKENINGIFNSIVNGKFGTQAIQWPDGTSKEYTIYEPPVFTSDILSLISSLSSKTSIFNYRYNNFQMRGYFNADQKEDPNLPFDDTDIQIIDSGTNINSNTSLIKAKKDSNYVAFYSKYSSCVSKETNDTLLNRKFESSSPSIDVSSPIDVFKNSSNVLTINRNLDYINRYQNSQILSKLTKSFNIISKKLEFTLNYFYENIPTSFLSSGLVGLSINISENGMTASYTYSNEMLKIPESEQFIEKLEQSIKDSYIRNYVPPKERKV